MNRGPAAAPRVLGVALAFVVVLSGLAGGSALGPADRVPPAHPSFGEPARPAVLRDPMISGDGVGRILVTNTDPIAAPNTGLRTELEGFKIAPFTAQSSLQVGVEEVLGNNLAVFGLFQNSALGAYPFFSVFNNTTGKTLFQTNESLNFVTPGVAYDFALQYTTGTNWSLELNGAPFGGSAATSTLDFGVTSSTDASGITFSMIALSRFPIVPPSLLVYTAFAVRLGSNWYLPQAANSTWRGASSVEWGVAGSTQNPAWWPGELDEGTGVGFVPNGTTLWSGGPRPASAQLSSAPTSAFGGGTTLVSTTFATSSGPIPDIPVELRDTAGGGFLDAELATDANGTATTAYLAPNVTANTTDVLSVQSNILGIDAPATTSVAISPSVQVRVAPVGDPQVAPGATSGVELEATRAVGGASAVGIQLSVVLQGGGGVQPSSGVTDRDGHLTVNITAPKGPGTLTLTVVVSTPGYWGKARIAIEDAAPPPSLSGELTSEIGWILLAVVILIGIAVFVRSRLPRSRMRPMELRRRVPTTPPGAPPGTAPPMGPGTSEDPKAPPR